jgi:hypothetical protein
MATHAPSAPARGAVDLGGSGLEVCDAMTFAAL